MKSETKTGTAARALGALIGAGIAFALIAGSGPASGGEPLGAEVSFYSNRTGELAVSPPGPDNFLHEPALMPGGGEATGGFKLTNQTAEAQRLRIVAVGSNAVLDDEMVVELTSGGQVLATGTLGELAEPSARPLLVMPGSTERILVSARLPEGTDDAAAALVEVAVTFEPAPGGAK